MKINSNDIDPLKKESGISIFRSSHPILHTHRQIEVSSLPPGVYITILKNGYDIVESRKFVVAH
jgi:hypothetical protein